MTDRDSALAFGGAPPLGEKILKWAHLDEAGTSVGEGCCVVAGVVTSPDGQWRQLKSYLDTLRTEFAPNDPDLVFHAKDIFHGTKAFHRDKWTRDKRNALLREISRIPHVFNLPVIGAAIDKSTLTWGNASSDKSNSLNYGLAFGMCVINFESYLRELPDSREVGTITAEDMPHMRRYAEFGYSRIRDKKGWDGETNSQYLPIHRVMEQPAFTSKLGSPYLQIADCIAFLLARYRNGGKGVESFIDEFQKQIYVLPHKRPRSV